MREPLMIMWLPAIRDYQGPQFLKKPIGWTFREVMFDISFRQSPLCTAYKRMR